MTQRLKPLLLIILASAACKTTATPLVGGKASAIYLGTNAVNTAGARTCKLLTNKTLAVVAAKDLMTVADDDQVAWDAKDQIWRVLETAKSLADLEKALPHAWDRAAAVAKRYDEAYERRYGGKSRTGVGFVMGDTNVMAAETGSMAPAGRAYRMTWQVVAGKRVARLNKITDFTTGRVYGWAGEDAPVAFNLQQGGSDPVTRHVVLDILDVLAKGTPARSFKPPYLVVSVRTSGITREVWEEDLCAKDRQRALARLARLDP